MLRGYVPRNTLRLTKKLTKRVLFRHRMNTPVQSAFKLLEGRVVRELHTAVPRSSVASCCHSRSPGSVSSPPRDLASRWCRVVVPWALDAGWPDYFAM